MALVRRVKNADFGSFDTDCAWLNCESSGVPHGPERQGPLESAMYASDNLDPAKPSPRTCQPTAALTLPPACNFKSKLQRTPLFFT